MEEWCPIVGFENYLIDKNGDIVSLHRSRLLIPSVDKDGYLSYTLVGKDGCPKTFRAHRLVLMTFDPIENEKSMQVNHRNGVKNDNRLENLEWVTSCENIRHRIYEMGVQTLVKTRKVRCVETGVVYPSLRAAARAFGRANHGPLAIALNPHYPTNHTYMGYHWEYA